MSLLLIDTGALVAALDRSSTHHLICADALTSAQNTLVTCEAVITEMCFLQARAGYPAASGAVLRDIQRGEYQLPLKLSSEAEAIARLMKKYVDRPMSFADACLVQLATQLNTGRILTLDSDFHIYRWGRNRPFELLIDMENS